MQRRTRIGVRTPTAPDAASGAFVRRPNICRAELWENQAGGGASDTGDVTLKG
jgi:hypothetical protein